MTTSQACTDDAVVERYFDALIAGDIEAAKACCTPDMTSWHSYDGVVLDIATAEPTWRYLATIPDRAFIDRRRYAIPGGFVQQCMLVLTLEGKRQGWPSCIVITMRDGLIYRMDEYIASGRPLPMENGEMTTPGLLPA